MSFLAPVFLLNNIGVISLIIAGFLLIIFDNIVTRSAFKMADAIKESAHRNMKTFGDSLARFASESAATVIILIYAYFGTTVLAEYVFSPILFKLREYLLIWIIIIFLLISWVVNNKGIRHSLMEA